MLNELIETNLEGEIGFQSQDVDRKSEKINLKSLGFIFS